MRGDEGRAEASIPREEQKVGRGPQEECIVMFGCIRRRLDPFSAAGMFCVAEVVAYKVFVHLAWCKTTSQ